MILYSENISVRISLEKITNQQQKKYKGQKCSSNLLINITFLEQTQSLSSFYFCICQSFCNFLKQFIDEKCTVHAILYGFFLKGKNHTDDVQVSKNVSNLMHLALQGYTQLALV